MKVANSIAEPDINSLSQQAASSWPYAVREFVKWTGMDSPISAAQTAASQLLTRYFSLNTASRDSVSVGALCDILGIALKGRLPRTKFAQAPHLAESVAHTAKLGFEYNHPIIEVMDSIASRARISAAHELGHYLIHLRNDRIDYSTLRAGSTPAEEVLSEYIGRLLLMPLCKFQTYFNGSGGYPLACLTAASKSVVSLPASATRLGDPDQPRRRVCGIILWKLNPGKTRTCPTEERLTPHWHLCTDAFIPIRKCHARKNSITAILADSEDNAQGAAVEQVKIGTLTGNFLVEAFAWGSLQTGTRSVLSVFLSQN